MLEYSAAVASSTEVKKQRKYERCYKRQKRQENKIKEEKERIKRKK